MANYYTNFSLVITLKDTAEQQYALELASKAARHFWDEGEQPSPTDVPEEFVNLLEDWSFHVEPDNDTGIWVHSDSGGIDAACAFIQHLLKKFNLEKRLSFEWSNDCSQPRVDAYGGGAAIITAEKILTMSTSQWLEQQTK